MLSFFKSLIGNRHPLRIAWHQGKAFVAALYYGFPARKLTVIGITGTDGKTTTVGMLAHILDENGIVAGALSTAFFRIREQITWNETQKTSPSPFTTQRFLRMLVSEGCTHAVLEYSSHGLVQHRTDFTWPTVAAITNTSAEHLDYHGTMEQYRADKGKLFAMLKQDGTKVLNADDETFAMYRDFPSAQTFVYSPAHDLSEIQCHVCECRASVSFADKPYELCLKIPGAFNLENALCAIQCARAAGVDAGEAVTALASFAGVPGRMEHIDEGQPFAVYVDFTVTPASYEKTLSAVKASLENGKRLLVLTGSCGDRMREKRPQVGAIVSRFADVMVVANEDPYTEDPQKIIDEVWTGIDQSHTKALKIFDRKQAIDFLLHEAKSGDAVLLCGKGSDTTMWVKEGQVPWNEREIVREALRTLQAAGQ